MKNILNWFAESYFTMPILMVCQISAAMVCYHHRNKFNELKYFHLYPIASLLQGIFSLLAVSSLDANRAWTFSRVSVVVFVFLEALLLYNFFSNTIKIKSFKIILKVLFIAFLLYSIAVFALTKTFLNSGMIITGETTIVILSVCLYFVQLFRIPASQDILGKPAFWINIGILFVFSCTFPAIALSFFGQGFILSYSYFFFINFMGYSVLFLFIIRGYLCKREQEFPVDENLILFRNDARR